jgi:hypothetical protein
MKGGRSPDQKFLHHFLGDIDPSLGAHFLFNEIHGKDRGKVLGANRLSRAGMEKGLKGRG